MYDLFNPIPSNMSWKEAKKDEIEKRVSQVKGLRYFPEYIDREKEMTLMKKINSEEWLTDLKRRVQHYGYKYDYRARAIDYSMYLGPLPPWVLSVAKQLKDDGHIDFEPDQVIVNEYLPGQGIASHVDCEPCFGDTIISLSLNAGCVMDFINIESKQRVDLYLEPRSIIILSGEARYKWTHGIAARKYDLYDRVKLERYLRISLTFRGVIMSI